MPREDRPAPLSEWTSHSPEETERLAATLAAGLAPGRVIRLEGDLGAGKTCFARGLVRALGIDAALVSSPSFALVHEYRAGDRAVYHWDLYRLSATTDWSVLDLPDHLADPAALTLIEWPDRYPGPWPPGTLRIHLTPTPADPSLRTITVRPHTP